MYSLDNCVMKCRPTDPTINILYIKKMFRYLKFSRLEYPLKSNMKNKGNFFIYILYQGLAETLIIPDRAVLSSTANTKNV